MSDSDYPFIEDYGLIGDCHSAALISSAGSLDWLCMPAFDSPSIFARILDIEKGGAWGIQPTAKFHSTHKYVGETAILETSYQTDAGSCRVFSFMPVSAGKTHYALTSEHSVMRVVEGVDGEVELESVVSPRPDYAQQRPTLDVEGSCLRWGKYSLEGPEQWDTTESTVDASCRFTVKAGERKSFVLRFDTSQGPPPSAPPDAMEHTQQFWCNFAERCTYKGPYRDAVVRSAITLRLLAYTPTGAIVAAPTTSLPEDIGGALNWDYRFTWLRDSAFTLYALLLAGYNDEDKSYFDWTVRTVQVEKQKMRILYPVTPEGTVAEHIIEGLSGYRNSPPVRVGNAAVYQRQMDVYGEVLDALHFATKAGGYDPRPVWEHFRPLVDWVADHWHEPGRGIWEVRAGARHFVYGKVMMWCALDRGVKLATAYKLDGDVDRWKQQRDAVRDEVMRKGWSDRLHAFKQSYEDDRLDAANLQMPVVGFIDGDDPRMVSTIDATLDRLVVDGLCYRYLAAPVGVPGKDHTFVLCTCWLIDALLLAGRTDHAQQLFDGLLKRASSLGLYAEEIDHITGHHLGNFPQAFSHIGIISSAVSLAHAGQAGQVSPQDVEKAERAGVGGGGQGPKTHTKNKES